MEDETFSSNKYIEYSDSALVHLFYEFVLQFSDEIDYHDPSLLDRYFQTKIPVTRIEEIGDVAERGYYDKVNEEPYIQTRSMGMSEDLLYSTMRLHELEYGSRKPVEYVKRRDTDYQPWMVEDCVLIEFLCDPNSGSESSSGSDVAQPEVDQGNDETKEPAKKRQGRWTMEID